MEESNKSEGAQPIVTAHVCKGGHHVKRWVTPTATVCIARLDAAEIADNLRRNIRMVLVDDSNQRMLDIYNVLSPDGKLMPCARILAPFLESCHYGNNAKVVIKHGKGIVGHEGLAKLNREAVAYAKKAEARRSVRAVPRRYINAQCPNCGHVFNVDLVGFGADGE